MTDVSLQQPLARRSWRAAVVPNLGVGALGTGWLLWAVNFNVLAINEGDSTVQYTFLRRLFGEDVSAFGYHFGLALLEAPFYALGKLLAALGLTSLGGVATEEAAVAFGASLFVLAGIVLCVWLLRRLELPYAAATVLVATFGTPLFFYGTFIPGKTHAWDAVLFTVVLALLLVYVRSGMSSLPLVVALGAVFGVAWSVRYFSAAAALALVLGLVVLGRRRHAAIVALTGIAVGLVLLVVPWAVGVSLTEGGNHGPEALNPDLLGPAKMLFTERRGLFVWSPVALIGLIGYIRLLRRPSRDRTFLALAGAMGLAIVLSYALIPWWDGTWSFSQRFFTPLFPLVAIGVAGLAAARPRLTLGAAALAAAWSVYLALTLQTVGPPHDNYDTIEGGAFDLAVQPAERDIGPGAYVWGVRNLSRLVP